MGVSMIYDIFLLARRLVRNQLKMPSYIFLSLSQPLMYLLFFGAVFSNIPQLAGPGGHSYLTFLTPGMAILAALFGSSYIAVGTLADVERGLFDRVIVSPVARFAVSFSYIAANLFIVLLQAAVIIAVGCVFGDFPPGGVGGIAVVLVVAMLVGIAFGALSNVVGFVGKRTENVMSIMNFLTMPLMFLSGMLISVDAMPPAIHRLVSCNPIHWAVSAAQAGYFGHFSAAAGGSLCLLALFAAGTLLAMQLAFLRFVTAR